MPRWFRSLLLIIVNIYYILSCSGSWDHPFVYATLVPIMGGVAYASASELVSERYVYIYIYIYVYVYL